MRGCLSTSIWSLWISFGFLFHYKILICATENARNYCTGPPGGLEYEPEKNAEFSSVWAVGSQVTFKCRLLSTLENQEDFLLEDWRSDFEDEDEEDKNSSSSNSNFSREKQADDEESNEWFEYEATCLENQTWSGWNDSDWDNGTGQLADFQSFQCVQATYKYCGGKWFDFFAMIDNPLEKISMAINVFGILTNFVSLLVFTRKRMRGDPLNIILAALCLADLFFLLNLLVTQSLVMYRRNFGDSRSSFVKQLEFLLNSFLRIFLHTRSQYLTGLAGFWNLWSFFRKTGENSVKRVKWIVFWTVSIPNIPFFVLLCLHRLEQVDHGLGENMMGNSSLNFDFDPDPFNATDWRSNSSIGDFFEDSPLYEIRQPLQGNANLLIYEIVEKLVPCLFVLILIPGLLYIIFIRKKAKPRTDFQFAGMSPAISFYCTPDPDDDLILGLGSKSMSSMDPMVVIVKDDSKPTDRSIAKGRKKTTIMLLIILLIFLLTELPKSIYVLLTLYSSEAFALKCLIGISHFMAFLESLSGALNFFIFLTMSDRFRSHLLLS